MLKLHSQRGDTIIEVMFSFVIFSLVVVSAVILMNQGVAMAQRSLEITLVRQQIDGQVALVQQAQQQNSAAWQSLKSTVVANPGDFTALSSCPAPGDSRLSSAKFMGVDPATFTVGSYALSASSYSPAITYSMVDIAGRNNGNVPHTYGLWLVMAKADGADANKAYDLYVTACWPTVGTNIPATIGTVVRLYAIN